MKLLFVIVLYRKKDVAVFLIEKGADVTIQAKNGCTAFDMALIIGKNGCTAFDMALVIGKNNVN